MKAATKTIGTVCFALLLLVSGVLAQETIKAPLKKQNVTKTKSSNKPEPRVSIVDYVKAVETIKAYNNLHKDEVLIPGVSLVSLQLAPEPSYRDLITSKLRDWDILRTDWFVQFELANQFEFAEIKSTESKNDNRTSSWIDDYWRRQETINEFGRNRFPTDQSWSYFTSAPGTWQSAR